MLYPRLSLLYITNAAPIWRRFDRHNVARAAARARFRLGSRMLISSAMMPMTTSNSTRVNARERRPTKTGWPRQCVQRGLRVIPNLLNRGPGGTLWADGRGHPR